jgi:sec-independent protein translocase protein TatC
MINFKVHLHELKLKTYYLFFSFFITFIVSYLFAPNLINIVSYPFLTFVKDDEFDFIFTNVFEVFNTYYTLAFYNCCFSNVPLGLYFMFTFIKPGLFRYEKEILFSFFKFFICSVVSSCLFIYYVIFPLLLFFLLSLDLITDTNFVFIKMETKIYDYVSFICKSLFFYCFVVFQIPLFFLVFTYLKQPIYLYVIDKRKFWIFFCLIIGCIFSSPDLLSLFIIAIPLLLFFEMLVFFLVLKYNYKNVYLFILESCLNGKRQVC